MKKSIILPFNQKVEISSKLEFFTENQELFIDFIEEFANEAIEVLKEKELNWVAKLGGMTNHQYALNRCKLIQRDMKKLNKLGCDTLISKNLTKS